MSDDPSKLSEEPVDGCAEDKVEAEEEEEYHKNKAFRAKCKIILICIAIFGFVLKIIIFPILSILNIKYGWGIEFPDLQLDTISALLSSLF